MNSHFLLLVLFVSLTNQVISATVPKRFIFRQDDIEDWFHNTVQADLLNWFMDNNVPVSAGIIGNNLSGQDNVMMTVLNRCVAQGYDKCTLWNHNSNHSFIFGTMAHSVAQAQAEVAKCDQQIKSLFPGYQPFLMCPPTNSWNQYLLQALQNLGYKIISASTLSYSNMAWDLTTSPMQMPQQTQTGDWDDATAAFVAYPIASTVADCEAAAAAGQVCVIMTHPHEFANGAYTFTMLGNLVQSLYSAGFTATNFYTVMNEQLGLTSSPTAQPTQTPTTKPTVFGQTNSPTIAPTAKAGDNINCGPAYGGTFCGDSTQPCCSQYGWCGIGTGFCDTGCQAAYGICNSATPVPTAVPSRSPTAAAVTNKPTIKPTTTPTVAPTATVTGKPTTNPTILPSRTPTTAPTTTVTQGPTVAPTITATQGPTAAPTTAVTQSPTIAPTVTPTIVPTIAVTQGPTAAPTATPTTAVSSFPTAAPTVAVTTSPTASPTVGATTAPSPLPTTVPTSSPTAPATTQATQTPPTVNPTVVPTAAPSVTATTNPTANPTPSPTTGAQTGSPTMLPTTVVTKAPTANPTANPTVRLTTAPSMIPTTKPSTTSQTSSPTVSQSVVYSTNGRCGPGFGNAVCGDPTEPCCSQYGWCGATTAHCGIGCQSLYGRCNVVPTISPTIAPTTAPTYAHTLQYTVVLVVSNSVAWNFGPTNQQTLVNAISYFETGQNLVSASYLGVVQLISRYQFSVAVVLTFGINSIDTATSSSAYTATTNPLADALTTAQFSDVYHAMGTDKSSSFTLDLFTTNTVNTISSYNSAPSSGNSTQLSTKSIGGIVAGSCIVALLVFIGIYFWYQRCNRKHQENERIKSFRTESSEELIEGHYSIPLSDRSSMEYVETNMIVRHGMKLDTTTDDHHHDIEANSPQLSPVARE